jgi:hypothetical protein
MILIISYTKNREPVTVTTVAEPTPATRHRSPRRFRLLVGVDTARLSK